MARELGREAGKERRERPPCTYNVRIQVISDYTGCLFKKFATLIMYQKLPEFLWKISHLECSYLANLASLNLWLPTLSKTRTIYVQKSEAFE